MEEALLSAAHHGEEQPLIEILEVGETDVDVCDAEMTTPLMLASLEGHVECVNVLLIYGAFANARRSSGSTALFLAAQCGHYDVVNLLLSHGAMIDLQNESGGTALFVAAQMGHADIVTLLCSRRASVHLSLKDMTTPLFAAAQNGYLDVVRILERHRADMNSRRVDGVSPVWIASQMGHADIVEYLCLMGAHVDRPRNSDGVTALFKAASNGHDEVVSVLMKYFPNISVLKCGYSPLHAAALWGHLAVAEIMLEYGVSPAVKDKDGNTPVQLAERSGFEEMASIMSAY